MTRSWNIAGAVAVLGGTALVLTGAASAQPAPTAQSVLAALSKNMGADNLKCITFGGTVGYVGIVGQAHDIKSDWPKVLISKYTRTINYDAKSSYEDRTIEQGNYPRIGGGGIPLQGQQRAQNYVLDKAAWNMQGNTANPQPDQADVRAIDIWMSPHGFIKGAMAPGANPVLITRYENGAVGTLAGHAYRKLNVISFTFGKYRINGTISPDNLLERVETRIANPVRGDMNYEAEYSQWRDVNGVKFPGNFHNHTDWDNETQPPNYNGGHNSFGLTVTDIKPNDCGQALSVPANVASAAPPQVTVTTQTLAPGITYLTGGTHHSVAVEFNDYIALVEAPLNQARTLAVFNAVRAMYPNKPIKYVVNSHNHYDHLGGIRTAFHEGAVIITHSSNHDFYKNEVLSHDVWTLDPDRLSLYPPTEFDEGYQFEDVDTRYTLSDGTRNLDVLYLQGSPHAEGMVMAYLPKEKILIEADVYTPPAMGAPMPAQVPAAALNLYENIKGYKLDVATVVGLHGRAVPWAEFLRFVQKPN
jgi:glyoxylase-like metal-dependent hydrolase (beta-lactamase superfamily II)